MALPTIGISQFYLDHARRDMGNSYTKLAPDSLASLAKVRWEHRTPGRGETTLDRKVLVPIPHDPTAPDCIFFCPPRAKLVEGMRLRADAVVREPGEDPHTDVYVTPEDVAEHGYELIDLPAKDVQVVCYSADALLENNGRRTTGCEWEVVTLLCSAVGGEPMPPLTMARNYLEKAGGTKGEYSAREFAEAIWHHSVGRGVKVRKG